MSISSEWKDEGTPLVEDLYFPLVHKFCGTRFLLMGGFVPVCPKCQPEEFAKLRACGWAREVQP